MRESKMKKGSLNRRVSMLLVIALIVTSFPSYVFGYANPEDAAQPVVTTEETPVDTVEVDSEIKYNPNYNGAILIEDELLSKRGEFEKHFVQSDGSMIAVSYAQKVHYEVNGTWKDIDSRLELKDKEKGLYGPVASDLMVSLPSTATADILVPGSGGSKSSIVKLSSSYLTKITDGEYAISWNILGNSKDYTSDFLSKATAKTLEKTQIPTSALATGMQPDLSKLSHDEQMTALPNLFSTATYKNVIKNVDVEVIVTPDKVKENIIVSSPKGFESISYLIDAGNLIGKIEEDNSVTFTNEKADVIFTIPAPYMFDSKVFPDDSMAIGLALSKTTDGYILTMTPDSKWINDPGRVYPVIIDPTVTTAQTVMNVLDTYVHSGDAAGNHYLTPYVKIGKTDGATCRGYIGFANRPTIDTNVNDIVGGNLIGYLASGTNTYHPMTIYQPTSAWSTSTITWANKPANSAAIATVNGQTGGTYIKYTFPVNASVINWYATGVNNGYMIKYDNEAIIDYNWIYASDHPTLSTSYYPCLQVSYIPDTTAPILGSIGVTPSTTSTTPTLTTNPTITWWAITEAHLASVQYKVDNGAYVTMGSAASGSYTMPLNTITSQGQHIIKIKAVDMAGNFVESAGINYYVDDSIVLDSATYLGNVSLINYYGKNVIHWNPPTTIPSQVYYKVYRGTTSNFTMDSSTLLAADLKSSYFADMSIGGTGTYYYKVKVIKKNTSGGEIVSDVVSSALSGEQKPIAEFSAGIGQNFYMDYFTFGTPSGNGYVEKRFGNLGYTQQDYSLTNMEFDYGLARTYNSQSTNTGMIGKGWSDSYHMELYNENGKIYLRMGDGTTYTFTVGTGGLYQCDQTMDYSLTVNTTPVNGVKYTIKTKDNTSYDFNINGQVMKASKPTGIGLRYEYDSFGRLAKVASLNALGQDERQIEMTYSATNPYTLSKIVLPDLTERVYDISSTGQLDAVTYSRGGFTGGGTTESVVFDYSYDASGLLNLIKDGEQNAYSVEYTGGKASKVNYPNSEYFQIGYTTDSNGNTINTVTKKFGSSEFYTEQAVLDEQTGKRLTSTNASGITTQFVYTRDSGDTCNNLLIVEQTISQRFFETLIDGTVGFASQPIVETKTISYDITTQNITQEKEVLSVSGAPLQTEITSYTYGQTGINANAPTVVAEAVNGTLESETTYEYNGQGRVINETVDPLNSQGVTETEYIYTPNPTDGSLVTEEKVYIANASIPNQTGTAEVNGEGQVTETTSIAGTVQVGAAIEYDLMGCVVSEVDLSGKTTTHAYDYLGREISVTSDEGGLVKTTASTYNKNSSLTSTTDELGITTTYTFDSINRELSKTTTGGGLSGGSSTTSYGYEYSMSMPAELNISAVSIAYKETTTQNGQTRTKWSDGKGNLVKETSGGVSRYFKYDQSGNQVLEFTPGDASNPARASMTLYDQKGNLFAAISNPEIDMTSGVAYKVNSNTQDAILDSILTKTLYYDNGKVKAQIDGKSIITHFTYDTMDRVIGITEDAALDGSGNLLPGGIQTNISYPDPFTTTTTDGAGVLSTRIVDKAGLTTLTRTGTETTGITTAFSYDTQGRLVKETYKDSSFKTYFYNTKGQVATITTSILDPNNSTNSIEQTKVEYTYNSLDQMIGEIDSQRNALGEMTAYHYEYFEYDSLGQMTGATALNQAAIPTVSQKDGHKTSYSYNAAGQVTEITYPLNSTDEVKGLKYIYDGNGRITEVKANLGTIDKTLRTYAYDCFGAVSGIYDKADFTGAGTNTIQRNYSYDGFGRVVSMQYMQGSTTLESFTLAYDSNSNITSEVDGNITKGYSYDDLGRLTTVQTTQGQTTGTTNYTYDNAGNRLSKETDTTRNEYVYNGLNQLTAMVEKNKVNGQFEQAASTAYTYDLKGNLTQDSETRGSVQKVVNNSYTVDSRLAGTTILTGAQTTLNQKNTYNGSGQRISKDENGTPTNYFYQGNSVLYTTDGSDVKTSQNFLNPVGSVIDSARYAPTDISYYLYNKDIRNSTASILDETGSVATKYSYDEFGVTEVDGSYTLANEICYTGGIYDWNSGQYYLNARYYDPELGRFLSEDTYRGEVNEPNSWHLYVYCANNPINYVDPSGHAFTKYYTRNQCKTLYWQIRAIKANLFLLDMATAAVKIAAKKVAEALFGYLKGEIVDGIISNPMWLLGKFQRGFQVGGYGVILPSGKGVMESELKGGWIVWHFDTINRTKYVYNHMFNFNFYYYR